MFSASYSIAFFDTIESTRASLGITYGEADNDWLMLLSEKIKNLPNLTSLFLQLRMNPKNDKDTTPEIKYLFKTLGSSSTITSLSFRCFISSAEAELLSNEIMMVNTTLRDLSLWLNSVHYEEVNFISSALENNSTLIKLNLGNNGVSDQGVLRLSKMLQTNSTLTSLNLKLNPITAIGVDYLTDALVSNTTLTSLNLPDVLNDTEEGRIALKKLIQKSPNLIELTPANAEIEAILTTRKNAFNYFESFLKGTLTTNLESSVFSHCLLGMGGLKASIDASFKNHVSELTLSVFAFTHNPSVREIVICSEVLPTEAIQIILKQLLVVTRNAEGKSISILQ